MDKNTKEMRSAAMPHESAMVKAERNHLDQPVWSSESEFQSMRIDVLLGEIARLRAGLEAVRVDAERYRWLRHADMDGVCVVDVNVWLDFDIADCEQIDGEKLDAAIDAARGGK